MNLSKKLELMRLGGDDQNASKGTLSVTTDTNSLAKLAESSSVSISEATIRARAYDVIEDVSTRMRRKLYMILIFDESKSMWGTERDMENGFRQLADEHCDDNIDVTTVLFNDSKRIVHREVPIQSVTDLVIRPDGRTRLYDTAIETIQNFDRRHPDVSDNVIFVIATDGDDNKSRYGSIDRLRDLVKENIARGRRFYFLGDSIDAIRTAREMGIDQDNAVQYSKDDHGFIVNFLAIGNIINELKTKGSVSKDWKRPVEDHYLALEQKSKRYEIKL